MANKKSGKIEGKFHCEKCDYVCRYYSDFTKHLSTDKHKRLTMANKKYSCDNCGKCYKHASSLSKHRKKCKFINIENSIESKTESNRSEIVAEYDEVENKQCILDNTINTHYLKEKKKDEEDEEKKEDYTKMMEAIMAENSELRALLITQQKQISDLIPKVGSNNTQNNNFNLNVFLNEHCKDALNMLDFINSLQVEFSQMEYTASNGFVEGMSNIFTKAIQNMDITKRPIHCTDAKREIIYIKDNEEWNKDNEEKGKMKLAIKKLQQNHLHKLSDWVHHNPGCERIDNPKNDLLLNMIREHATYDDKNIKKVIKSIAKNVTIPKNYNTEISYV